jgi:hypothetical protein
MGTLARFENQLHRQKKRLSNTCTPATTTGGCGWSPSSPQVAASLRNGSASLRWRPPPAPTAPSFGTRRDQSRVRTGSGHAAASTTGAGAARGLVGKHTWQRVSKDSSVRAMAPLFDVVAVAMKAADAPGGMTSRGPKAGRASCQLGLQCLGSGARCFDTGSTRMAGCLPSITAIRCC